MPCFCLPSLKLPYNVSKKSFQDIHLGAQMNWISLELLWNSTIVCLLTVIPDWWSDQILKQYISKIASSFNRKKIGNLHQFVRKTISYGYEVRFTKSKFKIYMGVLSFYLFPYHRILQMVSNANQTIHLLLIVLCSFKKYITFWLDSAWKYAFMCFYLMSLNHM